MAKGEKHGGGQDKQGRVQKGEGRTVKDTGRIVRDEKGGGQKGEVTDWIKPIKPKK